ncbi:hypothetical protein ABEF91_004260 [Exophiala dermatitidis]
MSNHIGYCYSRNLCTPVYCVPYVDARWHYISLTGTEPRYILPRTLHESVLGTSSATSKGTMSIIANMSSISCHHPPAVCQRRNQSTVSEPIQRPGPSDHHGLVIESSDTPDPVEPQWERILDDAFVYGIRSKDRLLFEADVGRHGSIGTRLVDRPPARRNFDIWRLLLRAQALQNGHDGIKAIWNGLQSRGQAIRFDDTDPQVEALWRIFLSAGASDHEFLWSLCKVARRAKFDRPALFVEIVGTALEGSSPDKAVSFASFLMKTHYRGRDDLLAIFDSACCSNAADSLKHFCKIYEIVPKTSIYSDVATRLWEQERSADAFIMHSFLVSKGDLPPRFEVIEPFLSYLAAQDENNLDEFLVSLGSAGASFESQARRFWSRERSRVTGLSLESLNIVASNTLGVNPKKLSDQFVARAFATRAFSFDFIVNSLRMVGLIEVGPLAVRQAALTAPDLATLQARFSKFDELGIDTGSSAFVRILRKVCNAGRWEMAHTLVHNDLHHEVFEDVSLQERLLAEYYRTQDWLQLNRTLVILNNGDFDDNAQTNAGSLLIKIMLEAGDWAQALKLIRNLQTRNLPISSTVARSIVQLLKQPQLVKSAALDSETDDRIAFLIGLLQDIFASGTKFEITLWRWPLRALGSLGRQKELECLVYWIAEQYTPKPMKTKKKRGNQPKKAELERPKFGHVLEPLFGDKFQKALVSWCFLPHKGMTTVSPEQCLRWTRILKRLRDVYGVEVKEYNVRWMFIRRLRWLFASGIRLKGHNLRMRLRNTTSAHRYWQLYDKMWDMKPPANLGDDRGELVKYMKRLKTPPGTTTEGQSESQESDEDDDDAFEDLQEEDGEKEDIVGYRDLFHASWEDYQKLK